MILIGPGVILLIVLIVAHEHVGALLTICMIGMILVFDLLRKRSAAAHLEALRNDAIRKSNAESQAMKKAKKQQVSVDEILRKARRG